MSNSPEQEKPCNNEQSQKRSNLVIIHTPEFDKCIKHLRKFKTIDKDLEIFKKALLVDAPDYKKCEFPFHLKIIPGFGDEYMPIYKVRKFHCEYLRDRTRIRLIFTYNPFNGEISFIEIYFKGDRDNENKELIKKYLIKKAV